MNNKTQSSKTKQEIYNQFLKASNQFLETHQAPESFQYNTEGLLWLAQVIEGEVFSIDSSSSSTNNFLDGAGATLALIVGHRFKPFHFFRDEQTYGISFGLFGIFFPFDAITDILQAEAPSEELIAQVENAEAEAKGNGPYSKTFQQFIRRIQTHYPSLNISDINGYDICFEQGFTVNLKQVCQSTFAEDESSIALAITNLLHLLPIKKNEKSKADTWIRIKNQIFPRIVSKDFIDSIQESQSNDILLNIPLFKNNCICITLREGKKNRFIRASEVREWKLSQVQILKKAIENLTQASQNISWSKQNTPYGNIWYCQNRDGLDSARALLPNLHELLQKQCAGIQEHETLIAIPHRDILIATSSSNPEMKNHFSDVVMDAYQKAPHRISNRFFTPGELKKFSSTFYSLASAPSS